MAALCTGSYGLSQSCTDDNKQYFFVKLTDSAYRAIEDYERNQNKYTTQAKIQICENGGVISFPTTKENAGQQFTFAIDEIEGSLECIQQKKTQLDVLGSLQYKMRIHANEDVYETTRHRMAVAEETQKKKSTVEIKPNQTDIGRRVKVKNSNNRFPTISSKRELMPASSTATFQPTTACPSTHASNLLLNGTGPTILPLSPSRIATNNQQNNVNVSSSNGAVIFGTSTGHTDLNNISLINANCAPICISSTQNYKNNLSNNSLNNIINNSNNKNDDNDNNNSNDNNNNNDNNNSNVNKNNNNHSNDNNSNNNMNDNNNNIDNNDDNKDNKNNNDKNNNINTNSNSDNNNSNISIIKNRSISCNGKNNCLSTAASSLSSVLSSAAGSGTSGMTGGYFNNTNNSNSVRAIIAPNTGNNSTGNRKNVTAAYSKINSRHNIPDIKKRAIRERLIHMLALKSFKKPEIFARLQNEGIRDKEKNLVISILKDISILRDNTYNLKHQIWNEINEDWPFYTEQEIQILKRRKPQNLTPPLSSDGGSSTSGQSPTSTHNGSPPPAVKRPSLDRGAYYEEPAAKKQRISHFKKDSNELTVPNNSKLQPDTDVHIMGLSYSVLGSEAARRISPRDVTLVNGLCQQEFNLNHNQNPSGTTNSANYKISNCFSGANANIKQKSPCSHNYDINTNSSLQNNNINNNNNIKNNNSNISEINMSNIKEKIVGEDNQQSEFSKSDIGLNASTDSSITNSFMNCSNSDTGSSSWSAFECGSTLNSDPSIEDLADNTKSNSEDIRVSENNNKYDFSRFKKITTLEQRRKYKTEFGNDYDEYRKLLNEIDSVRTRFNVLAQQLHNARNNDANYRSIKRQIIEEYQRIQSQREHQNIKARFNYLHGKLAHIKKLVNEFDKTLTASDSPVELSLSSELSENTNYRSKSPISPSTRNDSDHNSRFDLNCDNRLDSSSPSNSMHKTGGTPASFLGPSAAYHLPKNGNY